MPIETERLFLRDLILEDAERLFLLDSNPQVMKYIGLPVSTKVQQSEEVIRNIRKQYEDYGTRRWAVIEKKSGLLIGWSGLKYLTEPVNGHTGVYELGYRFLPEFWGKGYAKEAAEAFLSKGFEEMKISAVYACVHCENAASVNVLDKLGFRNVEVFEDELDGADCFWYELKVEDYKK